MRECSATPLDVGHVGAQLGARNDPGIVWIARRSSEHADCRQRQVDRVVARFPVDDAHLGSVEIDVLPERLMISVLRQPVSISGRIVVTAPADIWLPLFETASSTSPRRVNSASVRNRSRLRLGFSGMESRGSSQSSGTMSKPFASLYMWLRVSTAMLAMAGISQRLSCMAMT